MLTGISLLLVIFLAVVLLVVASAVFKLHPFLALMLAGLATGLSVGMPTEVIAESLNKGFGKLMTHIGAVVVLGCMIGTILQKSGATLRIALAVLALFGHKRPILGITVIGAVVGIPIFCDSGYVILSGLTQPLARQSGKSYAGISLGLAGGLYTTHTLLPPHPGPLAVVGNFGIASDLGIVILVGLLISVPVTLWVYVLASRLGKRIQITLPDKSESAEISKQLPHLFHAFLPIVVPILFLAIASFTDNKLLEVPEMLQKTLHFLGTPLVALLIGVGLASTLVPRRQKSNLVAWLREGAEQAGPILILVGAGGAFGALLAETPLKTMVSEWVLANQFSGVWFLWVAFLIGMFFKTAQGSTTSSMALTSAILAPLLASVGFDTPFELALLLSAVGAGAMAVSHTNDAYFWVISQFSGFSLRQGYQGITVLTLFQGLFTMLVVSVLYFLMI